MHNNSTAVVCETLPKKVSQDLAKHVPNQINPKLEKPQTKNENVLTQTNPKSVQLKTKETTLKPSNPDPKQSTTNDVQVEANKTLNSNIPTCSSPNQSPETNQNPDGSNTILKPTQVKNVKTKKKIDKNHAMPEIPLAKQSSILDEQKDKNKKAEKPKETQVAPKPKNAA